MAPLEWRRPYLCSLLCGAGLLLLAGFTFLSPASASGAVPIPMNWLLVNDSQALCNDYTRAGYFVNVRNTDKWLVFFESGSLCYSNVTCNRRFFQSSVRDMYNEGARLDEPFGNFDTERAWKERVLDATEENRVSSAWNTVSPYMSSMQCFQNNTGFFRQASEGQLAVNGTDILNPDCSVNPAFCNYSHVVVPYCSSDLWLASDNNDYRECSCFEYVQNDPACSFTYNPTSPDLQFAFRGRTIFRGVITDLIGLGMRSSSEVVLAGSSAGGLGVLNNAKWVKEEFAREGITANLKVIFESSWFINFQDSISRLFDGAARGTDPNVSQQNGTSLFDVIRSHEVCSFPFRGYPCCVSASCILTQGNSNGSFYPANVPTFGVVSLFDVYILAPALGTLNLGSGSFDTGIAIDFLSIVEGYGGTMNASIARVLESSSSNFLSLYLTSCLQHIYLATSTLWGPEGEPSVFGSSAVVVGEASASFTHQIVSGVWNTADISRDTNSSLLTMSSALSRWQTGVDRWFYSSSNRSLSQLVFRDGCIGVHCNDACPEQFALGVLTSNDWPTWLKIVIAAVVVALALICLLVKAMFKAWWFFYVRYRQARFLESESEIKQITEEANGKAKGMLDLSKLEEEDEVFVGEVTEAKDLVDGSGGGTGNRGQAFQFPVCSDDNAISVACVDIKYSVTFRRAKKKVKDEKTDTTTPLVLTHLEEDEDEEVAEGILLDEPQTGRRHPSQLIHRASQLFRAPTTPSIPKTPLASAFPFSTHSKYFSEPTTPGVEADGSVPAGSFGKHRKDILKGISVYFNPGEMIGVMGPSGSGKTTFLDLLTGRRKAGVDGGSIYVNGVPIDEIRDWYIANTGYVLQLATPYYSELTVRENLTLAAMMKLPDDFPLSKKFRRVEQVMVVTGLYKLADTKVGGVTGPGLSGGQKRRLVIALQLLKLPSVLFLDEPTSGLDATSSMELLNHLNKLASSNRTIVLTIHQPRLEIFHMFHRLMLISDGRVAYHGAPEKAYEVFVNALKNHYLGQGLFIPQLEDHNPADVIMDMLGNQRMRRIITSYYQGTKEPELVKRAIIKARYQSKSSSISSLVSVQSALFGTKVENRHATVFHRMAALETRGSKRADLFKKIYIPMVFFAYAFLLGTVYFQARESFLIISGFCVYSVASALFMFPFLYLYYEKALEVFTYERADGTGRAVDIVVQGFIRGTSVAVLPVVLCAGLLYILMVNMDSWNFVVYAQIALVNVALNQTWTALLIALICAFPDKAFRLSPIISSIAGFTSGFFIPINSIPWVYRWLAYINPNFYGFSASAFLLLTDFETQCEAGGGSVVECYSTSPAFILGQFNFENTNPYLNIVVLFVMTMIYLLLAVFSNWIRHNTFTYKLKIVRRAITRKSLDPSWISQDILSEESGEHTQPLSTRRPRLVPTKGSSRDSLINIPEEESEDELETEDESETEHQKGELEATTPAAIQLDPQPSDRIKARVRWQTMAAQTLDQGQNGNGDQMETEFTTEQAGQEVGDEIVQMRPKTLGFDKIEDDKTNSKARAHHRSHFLAEGHSHSVWNWKPKKVKKRPKLADLVERVQKEHADHNSISEVVETGGARRDTRALSERQRCLFDRVHATRAVLREQNEELVTFDNENSQVHSRPTLKDISKRVSKNMKLQKQGGSRVHFSDVVSAAVAQHRKEGTAVPHQAAATPKSSVSSLKTTMAIPIKRWKSLVKEQQRRLEQESIDASHGQVTRHTSDTGLPVGPTHIEKGSSNSPIKGRNVKQKDSLAKRDSVEIGKSKESELQRVKKAARSKGQQPHPGGRHRSESSSSASEADDMAPFVHAPRLLLKPHVSSGSLASERSKAYSPMPLRSYSSSPVDIGVEDSPSDALMPSPADLQPSISGSAASCHLPQSNPGPNAHHGKYRHRHALTSEVEQPTSNKPHLTTHKSSSDFSAAIDHQQQMSAVSIEKGHYGSHPGLSLVKSSGQLPQRYPPKLPDGHQRRHQWSTHQSTAVTGSLTEIGSSKKPHSTLV